jgi:hypothetical protein
MNFPLVNGQNNSREAFVKNYRAIRGGTAFCWSCDDLLREMIVNGKVGDVLKIYAKNGFRRKQLYVILERYGSVLGHETKKFVLDSRLDYSSMSHQDLRAMGLIQRARGGCVPECCGWEVVIGAPPVIVTLKKSWPEGQPLPESVRSSERCQASRKKQKRPQDSPRSVQRGVARS